MMKPKQSPNPFENLEDFKARSQENRQAAYENKVCKKILGLLFKNDVDEHTKWITVIGKSETPILEMQDIFEPFALRSHRMNSWGLQDLFLRPTKCEVWNTFATKGEELFSAFSDHIPALVFYNATLSQDMVIHSGIDTPSPVGHFRLTRMSNSGTGGIIVDTLPGFLKLL